MKVIDAAAIAFVVFCVTGYLVAAAVGVAAMVVADEPRGECFCWPLVLLATSARPSSACCPTAASDADDAGNPRHRERFS